jgi:hypothetical protein
MHTQISIFKHLKLSGQLTFEEPLNPFSAEERASDFTTPNVFAARYLSMITLSMMIFMIEN